MTKPNIVFKKGDMVISGFITSYGANFNAMNIQTGEVGETCKSEHKIKGFLLTLLVEGFLIASIDEQMSAFIKTDVDLAVIRPELPVAS